jgi:hypothetical protein
MVNSARLTRENHCLVYPLISHGGYWTLEEGWKLVGEATAPYGRSGQTKAIVFEKTTPAKESVLDMLSGLEPGIYWVHGSVEAMDIRTQE